MSTEFEDLPGAARASATRLEDAIAAFVTDGDWVSISSVFARDIVAQLRACADTLEPPPPAADGTLAADEFHAFFSAASAELDGHSVYRQAGGGEVAVTAVYKDREAATYNWPDKQHVGIVRLKDWIRGFRGRSGIQALAETRNDATAR